MKIWMIDDVVEELLKIKKERGNIPVIIDDGMSNGVQSIQEGTQYSLSKPIKEQTPSYVASINSDDNGE